MGSIRTAVVAAALALDRAVMPATCVFCGVVSESFEAGICQGCADDLPWNDNACPRCAEAQLSPVAGGVSCASCQAEPPPFAAAATAFRYAFPVDAAIQLFKYRRRLDYAPAFSAILTSMLCRLPADIDGIVPVPLHWRRQALRGFNQADELSRTLHTQRELPVIHCVRRLRATDAQSGLDAAARRKNMRGAFTAIAPITARHPVIVDDVITTGATCRELANELLRSGASRVSVLALARRGVRATTG